MGGLASWFRLDLRRRWRSLLVLALLVALAAGVTMTAVAGARRGASAVDRLWARTLPATVVVLPNQPGFDWEPVRALPEVEALTEFVVGGYHSVDGIPAEQIGGFPHADDEVMRTIERPVILEGRLADPARVDEVVVSPRFEPSFGKGVGDTLTLQLYSPEQVDAYFRENVEPETADGPVIEATIVGVVRSGWFSEETTEDPGGAFPSPALFAEYSPNLLGAEQDSGYINALVRLEGGETAIPRFKERLAEVSGRSDIDVWNFAEVARRFRDVTRFEANALLLFSLAAAVAALFLVGQSVARYSAATVADVEVLRAVGMSPRQERAAAAMGPLLAGMVGSGLGVAAAVIASRWFPIGSAALVEPAPGMDADWLVLGVAAVTIPLLVAAGAAMAASLALGSGRRDRRPSPSTTVSVVAQAGAPVPAVVGTRFALEPGSGRQAVPVRPALIGAVIGVLGVLAAFTFSSGVSDAATNLERFGQTYQLEAFLGYNDFDFAPAPEVLAPVADDPDVVAVNDARSDVAQGRDVAISVFTLDPVTGPFPAVVTQGRLPDMPGEIALGPRTAQAIDAAVGDRFVLAGAVGEREVMVTGLAFVPAASHNDYATGGWLTADAYDELFDGFKFHVGLVSLRPGADPATTAARLGETVGIDGFALTPPQPPVELTELQQVRAIPLFLAGFLAVLALGAVGHALATAVRRRRHDVAVLRAVGMTRWQSRGVVVTQATVLALVGLVIGVPLGLALGRTVWRYVADATPVYYLAPVALWTLLLAAPVALLAANLLAAWPSHRAASMRVGHVLRSE